MLSPGVEVKEIDISLRTEQVSNSIACFGGIFEKGPVDDKVLITNVNDFIDIFGKPTNTNFNQWFQVYNFLQYANKIWVARAFNEHAGNAFGYINKSSVGGVEYSANEEDRIFIKNEDDFSQMFLDNAPSDILARKPKFLTNNNELVVIAKTFGKWGEKIKIATANKEDFIRGKKVIGYKFEDLFEYHPGSEIFATTISADTVIDEENGELHLSVNTKLLEEAGETVLAKIKRGSETTIEALPIVEKDYDANLNVTQLILDVTFNGDSDKKWSSLPDSVVLAPKSKEIAFIVIYDNKIVEKYIVSIDPEAKDYAGRTTFLEKVINRKSNYVYVNCAKNVMPASLNDTTGLLELKNAYDDTSSADIINIYAASADNGIFANKETVDIDIIIANELCNPQAVALADDRKDCIAFIGATSADTLCSKSSIAVNNLIEYVSIGELNVESSFSAFFGNYKYQYDKFNDVYRWLNIAGDVAGLRADTSTKRNIWWASAGIERGQIKNAIKLAFNPTSGERDLLYKNKINPIVSFPGQGNAIVWGQKTLQSKASAFDRINVRGLFNTLERAISRMAKNYVFEINDVYTRSNLTSVVDGFLRDIKANRGIFDYYVRCDETNNTPAVIDAGQFIADIAIKPTRTAEFITLNFIAVSTDVKFETIFQ